MAQLVSLDQVFACTAADIQYIIIRMTKIHFELSMLIVVL